jgi:hypothetical protein
MDKIKNIVNISIIVINTLISLALIILALKF